MSLPVILELETTTMNTQTWDITALPFSKQLAWIYAIDQFYEFQEPTTIHTYSQKSGVLMPIK